MGKLGCLYAVNFDGGKYTRALAHDGSFITTDTLNMAVNNFLCVYLEGNYLEEYSKIMYSVQIGSYAKKGNAVRVAEKLEEQGYKTKILKEKIL